MHGIHTQPVEDAPLKGNGRPPAARPPPHTGCALQAILLIAMVARIFSTDLHRAWAREQVTAAARGTSTNTASVRSSSTQEVPSAAAEAMDGAHTTAAQSFTKEHKLASLLVQRENGADEVLQRAKAVAVRMFNLCVGDSPQSDAYWKVRSVLRQRLIPRVMCACACS